MNTLIIVLLGVSLLSGVIWLYLRLGRQQDHRPDREPSAARWIGDHAALGWAWVQDHWSREEAEPEPPPFERPHSRPEPPPPPERPRSQLAPRPVPEGTGIPPDHAALHARIAGFEPETDADLLQFWQREAAARLQEAHAWEAHADVLISGLGLDPASAQGAVELAGVVSDLSHDFGMVIAQFATVYEQVREAVASGLILPHRAREFLTGEGL